MRNLLQPAIASMILSGTNAKYLPVHVRQASTPAVLILEQNPGCCLVSSALSVCTSLTPGFTTLPPSQQAPCLCYSSTIWAPGVFDNAVKTCADFVSTAYPQAYTPFYNLENFCSNVGNAYGSSFTSTGTSGSASSNGSCNLVDLLVQSCASSSPGFATMSATIQASCLCYASASIWVPTAFDGAVSTCIGSARTADPSVFSFVQSLSGFCQGVGNVVSTGPVTTTTMTPVTIPVRPSAAGSAGSAPSKTSTDSTTSLDLTITIGGAGAATNTATVSKNNGPSKGVSEEEVILVSFACAAVVLFLC